MVITPFLDLEHAPSHGVKAEGGDDFVDFLLTLRSIHPHKCPPAKPIDQTGYVARAAEIASASHQSEIYSAIFVMHAECILQRKKLSANFGACLVFLLLMLAMIQAVSGYLSYQYSWCV